MVLLGGLGRGGFDIHLGRLLFGRAAGVEAGIALQGFAVVAEDIGGACADVRDDRAQLLVIAPYVDLR